MFKISITWLGIFILIQSCGPINNDSNDRAKKLKATFQEAGNCLEAAMSKDKEAARLITQNYIKKYDKFSAKECSDDDLKNALTVVECVKKELCSFGNNSTEITVFIKTWPKCRYNDKNPYQVSDACAQKTKGEQGLKTPYDEV